MKKIIIPILTLTTLLASACGAPVATVQVTQSPVLTDAPTQASSGGVLPTAEATNEPAETPDNAGIVLDEDTERMTPPPALSSRERGFVQVPCELGMPGGPGEVEGESYYCGIFTVPMFWDQPDSPNIDLHFIVTKATGEEPQPDPLVYLAGGPGQSAVISALPSYDQVRPTRDIVRMDQRGAGLSQRLGLEECLILAVKDKTAGDELGILVEFLKHQGEDTSDAPASPESGIDFDVAVHALCSKEFAAQGLDLDTVAQTAPCSHSHTFPSHAHAPRT